MEQTLVTARDRAAETDQYTLGQIVGIWALVSLPMALLAWVVAPALVPISPLHPGITYWLLMIAGMGWQFVVSLIILYRELGTLRWSVVRERIWLGMPRDPKTGQPNPKLFWWLIPAALFSFVVIFFLADILNAPMAWLFPGLQMPAYSDISKLNDPQFQGQWWIMGVTLVSFALNYFVGEELLFRGVLLPKMQGTFGKWDWVANAVLFGLYHLHKVWMIPSLIVSSLALTWPSRRFRSNWFAVIVHGIEGLPILVLVPLILSGLAAG